MAIFGLFLKSIFLVVLLTAVFVIGVVTYLYLRVRRVARSFSAASAGGMGQRTHTTDGGRTQRQSSAQNSGTAGTRQSQADNSSFANEELYDQRSPREANRKIFSKDEGEYVDFEEE